MMVIRPIQASDFASLHDIAVESGIGFTSLPVNDDLLRNKIARSEQSFASDVDKPGEESYLFVMEDASTREVVGTSGIQAAVGLDDAFYHYHVGKVAHASRELNIYNLVDILTFCNDYTGVTEICTLFLRERARKGNNGRFLSKFRFLFLAEHAQRFSETVIAEMRGVSDENGNSPFWQWLEEHFFSMDFPTADYLTGIGQKVFIAELMPKHPIYVSLLSKEAQAVIGKVHEKTKPALRLLQSEGFTNRGYVDIFDAGPTVEANLHHIRTVEASNRLPAAVGDTEGGTLHIVINTRLSGFRGVLTKVKVEDEQRAVLSQEALDALQIGEGDMVRFAPLKLKE
ncbi:arginine N-succinyltransferase [Aliiglaciecola sp. CAU 1673]|uniref:arginine N-succinyltransferase n=1 Tax=Aliiglaciecola sp. CAU 1673 TaxID=3032595 RepID=UPI0023DA8EC2|nr:arginine N-succinyltransferase [Aliiglaciecola sp. CAU 1673]MDF2178664.1 arginine N-succinyltransferase [Aliiglaciecola sp. CAU 1673]